jgi:hypothetical protein
MTPRTTARFAAGALALGGLMCSAIPAHAALTAPQANAFVVSASAVGGAVNVAPTPLSNYPANPGPQTVVGIAVAPFASNATLTATTAGDPSTGTSSASATVDSLGVTLPLGNTLAVTGINSTCNATSTGATGSGLVAGLTLTTALGTKTTIAVKTGVNSTASIAGLANITFNQQSTDTNGVLTVNALHITLLGGTGADIIIGQAQCGGAPASNVNPTPMISAPVAAGAGATAAVGGVVMVRRRTRKNVFDAS